MIERRPRLVALALSSLGFLTALALLVPPGRVAAQEAEPLKVWELPEHGFQWTRPDDVRWKFVPEAEWGRRYGGEKPPFLICMLGKWETPEGEMGRDPYQVLVTVFAYHDEDKIMVGGKSIDPGNVKGLADANFKMDTEDRYKDLKNVKKPTPRKTKYAREVHGFSFLGLHVKSGQVIWKEVLSVKGAGKKLSYLIDINCPAGNEEALRPDLEKLMEGLKLAAPTPKPK